MPKGTAKTVNFVVVITTKIQANARVIIVTDEKEGSATGDVRKSRYLNHFVEILERDVVGRVLRSGIKRSVERFDGDLVLDRPKLVLLKGGINNKTSSGHLGKPLLREQVLYIPKGRTGSGKLECYNVLIDKAFGDAAGNLEGKPGIGFVTGNSVGGRKALEFCFFCKLVLMVGKQNPSVTDALSNNCETLIRSIR